MKFTGNLIKFTIVVSLLFLLIGCSGILPNQEQLNATVTLIDVPSNMWWQDVNWWQTKDLSRCSGSDCGDQNQSQEQNQFQFQQQAQTQWNFQSVDVQNINTNWNTNTNLNNNTNINWIDNDVSSISSASCVNNVNVSLPIWHSEYDKYVYIYFNIKNTGNVDITEFTVGFTAYGVPQDSGTPIGSLPKSGNVKKYTGLSTGVNLAVGEDRDFFVQIDVSNDKVVWVELAYFDLE
jgi:hypothetical protein